MVDYVALPINTIDYDIDDGAVSTRAQSGKTRVRRLYAYTVYRFTVHHLNLKPDDYQTLVGFYDTNKNDVVTVTDPLTGESFTGLMLGPPTRQASGGTAAPLRISSSVVIEGTKDA